MKRCVFLLVVLLMLAVSAGVWAETTQSFNEYYTRGLFMTPVEFQNSPPSTYTVQIIDNLVPGGYGKAGISLDNVTWYDVESIFGFYAVSKDAPSSDFTASGFGLNPKLDNKGNTIFVWEYVENAHPADLAGWKDPNKELLIDRSNPSKDFTFESLALGSKLPVWGVHVRLYDTSQAAPFGNDGTGFIIPTQGQFPPTSAVPEPATLMAALSILAPAGLLFRRRK